MNPIDPGADPNQQKPWQRPQPEPHTSDTGAADGGTTLGNVAEGAAEVVGGAADAVGSVAGGVAEATGGCAGGCLEGCGGCLGAVVIALFATASTACALFR